MFITIEDETGIANLVVWVKVFEKYRPIVLSAGMMAIKGKIQREGDVVHLVANKLSDLSSELAGVGDLDDGFPLPHGCGDEFHNGSPTPDPRSVPKGMKARDFYNPTCTSIKSKRKHGTSSEGALWVGVSECAQDERCGSDLAYRHSAKVSNNLRIDLTMSAFQLTGNIEGGLALLDRRYEGT